MNFEVKDELYYNDLIYTIKSLANFEQERNGEIEERISKRQEPIYDEQKLGEFRFISKHPIFLDELYEIVKQIAAKAGKPFLFLEDIANYPEYVQEILEKLEKKKNNPDYEDNTEEVCAMPSQHNLFVVTPEKVKEFLEQRANSENSKQMKKVLSKVNIKTDRK